MPAVSMESFFFYSYRFPLLSSAGMLTVVGMPLPLRDAPKDQPLAEHELITNDTIYNCIAAPHPSDIREIMTTLLSTTDVTSCLNTINTLKVNKGLALADILSALNEELQRLDFPAQTRITWLEGLAEIEWRLSGGGTESVQTGGLVGVIRNGCDLIDR